MKASIDLIFQKFFAFLFVFFVQAHAPFSLPFDAQLVFTFLHAQMCFQIQIFISASRIFGPCKSVCVWSVCGGFILFTQQCETAGLAYDFGPIFWNICAVCNNVV